MKGFRSLARLATKSAKLHECAFGGMKSCAHLALANKRENTNIIETKLNLF